MKRSHVGVALVLGGWALSAAPAGAEPPRPDRPSAADLGVLPRSTYIRVPADGPRIHRAVTFAPGDQHVIYLNKNGGRYEPGWNDDSIGNVSSIVQWQVDMAPYPYGDSSWSAVLQCMRDLYAPFNVEVTDVDPGDVPHSEVVVSGHPTDIGMGNGVGGVAPMACQAIQGAVSFAFPETYGDDPTGICEAAGQESAHAFGLDHELLCSDIMTYQFCGPKKFEAEDSECGEFNARPCACGGDIQNSHEYLLEVLGPAAPQSDPPVVTIVRPAETDEVEAGFEVEVDVVDDGAILRVELHIDGELVGSRFEEPWDIEAPEELTLGPHEVEVVAFDETNVEGTAAVNVTVVEDDGGGGGRRSRGCGVVPGAGGGGIALVLVGLALGLAARRRRAA